MDLTFEKCPRAIILPENQHPSWKMPRMMHGKEPRKVVGSGSWEVRITE